MGWDCPQTKLKGNADIVAIIMGAYSLISFQGTTQACP